VIQLAGSVLVVVSAALVTACVVVYGAFHKWWRSPGGRHIFSFMAALAVSFDLGVIRLAAGDSEWFQVLRLLAFTFIPWVLGWRLVLLVRAVIAERKEQKEE
jgi:hypothetical protein